MLTQVEVIFRRDCRLKFSTSGDKAVQVSPCAKETISMSLSHGDFDARAAKMY